MFIKRHWWAIVYSVLLVAFTLYITMDTFVISQVYTVVPDKNGNTDDSDTERNENRDLKSDEIVKKDDELKLPENKDNENSDLKLSETTQESYNNTELQKNIQYENEDLELSEISGEDNEDSEASEGISEKNYDLKLSERVQEKEDVLNYNQEMQSNSSQSSESETIVTENSYSDENITIELKEYRENDTEIYAADIKVSSPEYLKTAFAKSSYGKNVTEKTSEIAESVNAVLAINGDYYGAQEKGYVIRNGVLYRNKKADGQQDLVIYKDGSFAFISEDSVTAEELLADGAEQVLSFGPALVINGNISVSEGDEVGKAKASNPRTAVGIIDSLHYVFVVSDGRTSESEGLSLSQMAEFMGKLGVRNAYNLDGGGSSTMYFNGEVVNNPTTDGKRIKERSVSDIVYIGY